MYGGMSRWCREHKVVSMGHFMEHGDDIFSRDMSGGNMMQLQKYSDMGGMDLVCGQLYPGKRNMGEYQMPKIASSISHTYNKDNDIAFCEIFGGYDQDLTYPTDEMAGRLAPGPRREFPHPALVQSAGALRRRLSAVLLQRRLRTALAALPRLGRLHQPPEPDADRRTARCPGGHSCTSARAITSARNSARRN